VTGTSEIAGHLRAGSLNEIGMGLVPPYPLGRVYRDFVTAARCLGVPDQRIIWRHLFPNLLGPIIVAFSFGVPGAIMAEAGLSFLGIGLVPPTPSWGIMLNDGFAVLRAHPHMALFPGLMIAITMLAFLFLGDGLRDAFDPRMKR
jgi:ABC-type dipeptide/oligopeptide/nickel transport system permease subunit